MTCLARLPCRTVPNNTCGLIPIEAFSQCSPITLPILHYLKPVVGDLLLKCQARVDGRSTLLMTTYAAEMVSWRSLAEVTPAEDTASENLNLFYGKEDRNANERLYINGILYFCSNLPVSTSCPDCDLLGIAPTMTSPRDTSECNRKERRANIDLDSHVILTAVDTAKIT